MQAVIYLDPKCHFRKKLSARAKWFTDNLSYSSVLFEASIPNETLIIKMKEEKMLTINIICVGKLKEKFFKDAIEEDDEVFGYCIFLRLGAQSCEKLLIFYILTIN